MEVRTRTGTTLARSRIGWRMAGAVAPRVGTSPRASRRSPWRTRWPARRLQPFQVTIQMTTDRVTIQAPVRE